MTAHQSRDRVVYDCNVYLQFLLNKHGPSARCVILALDGEIELFVSDEIFGEIRELPQKPIAIEANVTSVW